MVSSENDRLTVVSAGKGHSAMTKSTGNHFTLLPKADCEEEENLFPVT